jgi:glc operon protein GlcG
MSEKGKLMLGLDDAQRVLQAVLAEAQSLPRPVSVVVVDRRGDPVVFARMDGAAFYSVDAARGKALVAAVFGAPSAQYEASAGSPIMQQVSSFVGGQLFFRQGAVPIVHDGAVIGAVGVAGAESEDDERVAAVGAAELK